MQRISTEELMNAGVHFGHLRRKWNPKMLPYIFGEKKGIHIIDLNRTADKLEEAANAMKAIARSGKKILFVATKKQGKEAVKQAALRVNMPFVTERWLGGMLTNFSTIRKSIKKMQSLEKMLSDESLESITKKEKLVMSREREKLDKVLGGVSNMVRVPHAIFLVDISHEHIALKEAQRLNINTIGMVDTNSDPTKVDWAIPANDDAAKSIELITTYITNAIAEGLAERAANAEGDVTEVEEDLNDDNQFQSENEEGGGGRGDKKPATGRKRTTGGGGQGRSRIGGGTGGPRPPMKK